MRQDRFPLESILPTLKSCTYNLGSFAKGPTLHATPWTEHIAGYALPGWPYVHLWYRGPRSAPPGFSCPMLMSREPSAMNWSLLDLVQLAPATRVEGDLGF